MQPNTDAVRVDRVTAFIGIAPVLVIESERIRRRLASVLERVLRCTSPNSVSLSPIYFHCSACLRPRFSDGTVFTRGRCLPLLSSTTNRLRSYCACVLVCHLPSRHFHRCRPQPLRIRFNYNLNICGRRTIPLSARATPFSIIYESNFRIYGVSFGSVPSTARRGAAGQFRFCSANTHAFRLLRFTRHLFIRTFRFHRLK